MNKVLLAATLVCTFAMSANVSPLPGQIRTSGAYRSINPSQIYARGSYGNRGYSYGRGTTSIRPTSSNSSLVPSNRFGRTGIVPSSTRIGGPVVYSNRFASPSFHSPHFFKSHYTPGFALSFSSTTFGNIPRQPLFVETLPARNIDNTLQAHQLIDDLNQLDNRTTVLRPSSDLLSSSLPKNLVSTRYDAAKFQSLAEAAFRNGEYAGAIKNNRHAMLEDPENGKLHLFASHSYLAAGDFDSAITQLDLATAYLHQNKWDFLVHNRESLYGPNGFSSQLEKLNRTLSQNPNSVSALVLRGFHLGCLGQVPAARDDLTLALAIAPNDALARRLENALKPFDASSSTGSVSLPASITPKPPALIRLYSTTPAQTQPQPRTFQGTVEVPQTDGIILNDSAPLESQGDGFIPDLIEPPELETPFKGGNAPRLAPQFTPGQPRSVLQIK